LTQYGGRKKDEIFITSSERKGETVGESRSRRGLVEVETV
jgi:hypothetical protein